MKECRPVRRARGSREKPARSDVSVAFFFAIHHKVQIKSFINKTSTMLLVNHY